GSISSGKALNDMFNKQLTQAGERSIPLTLLILLLVFGAFVAAGVPLLLALSAVAATIGLVALPSHLVPMDSNVSAVLLLIGLAVGVDYSLFYLKREREERAAGKSHQAALEAAAATSGRSVLISGITVMIAMAGMLFSGDKSYLSFGIATMMVVAVARLGSLSGLDSRPKGVATVATIDKIQHAFPGSASPALVAIKANTDAPATIKAIDRLRTQALASGQMQGPIAIDINPSHTVARVAIPLKCNGTDATSANALKKLRNEILPATVGKLSDASYAVTCGTAASVDENALLKHSAPLV